MSIAPRLLFSALLRPVWAVVRDGRRIGEITEEADGSYWWRVTGMPFFTFTSTGAAWHAQQEVEQAADLPSGYRRKPMPEELRITKISDGAVLKPADGVSEE